MISAYARSDVGLRRQGNEDAFLCLPDRGLFAVADGMGGLACGEVASRLTVDIIAAQTDAELADMACLVRSVSGSVRLKGCLLGCGPIGTTLTLAVVSAGRVRLAQVGDSVAYLFLPGEGCRQLTSEQTMAEERRRSGRGGVEPYMEHILTQCLGQEGELTPETGEYPMPAGARLLLCSDGISKTVLRAEIDAVLSVGESPEAIVETLIRHANENGGPDNATAVAVFQTA